MRRHALLIAVEEYNNFPRTLFCHNDATLLAATLTEQCDFETADVVTELLSIENPASPTSLLDKVKRLATQCQDGDTILFFFAGHGSVQDDEPYLILPDTQVTSGPDRKFVPGTALPLRKVCDNLRTPGRINVRILDACQSGYDVRDGNAEALDAHGFTRAILTERAEGWLTLAGCAPEESSHGDPALCNGVFTHALCAAIKEFSENEEILPELLKVSVCRRVAQWCLQSGRVQTPTLNAALRGNVAIARRRLQLVVSLPSVQKSRQEENSSFAARLARARSLVRVGSEEHLRILTSCMESLHQALESDSEQIETWGLERRVFSPVRLDDRTKQQDVPIPFDFERRVVRFVDEAKLVPLHTVKAIEQRRGPLTFSLLFGSVDYTYTVKQSWLWPPSYAGLEVVSDGHVPGALFFIYVLPLHTKVCLISGVATQQIPSIGYALGANKLIYGYYDLRDTDLTTTMKKRVNVELVLLIEGLHEAIKARLDYLERESKL